MANKTFSCSLCSDNCRKRDVVCAKCWNGLAQARRDAISLAPYSRNEKGRKFLNELLTADLKIVRQMVAEHKIKPDMLQAVDEELEAVYVEINAGKSV